jgi:hypothetical protein
MNDMIFTNKRYRQKLLSQRKINKGGKRTAVDVQMDYVDEARLYLQGYSYKYISEWLGEHRPYTLSLQQVGNDIRNIQEMWREHYLTDMNTLKAQELARIDKLELQYWEAWFESRKHVDNLEQTKTDDEWKGKNAKAKGSKAGYSRTKTTRKRVHRDGNPKFLQGIERCIQLRIKLLGLDAEKTVNINWRQEARNAGIDPDEYVNDLESQFIKAASKGSSETRSLGSGTEEDKGEPGS